jgi:hypothetical protein
MADEGSVPLIALDHAKNFSAQRGSSARFNDDIIMTFLSTLAFAKLPPLTVKLNDDETKRSVRCRWPQERCP